MQRADGAFGRTESFGVKRADSFGVKRTESAGIRRTESSGNRRTESSGIKRTDSSHFASLPIKRTDSSSAKKGLLAPNPSMTIVSQRSIAKLSSQGGARGPASLNRGASTLDLATRHPASRFNPKKQIASRFRQAAAIDAEVTSKVELTDLDPAVSSLLQTAKQFNDVVRTMLAQSRKTLKEIHHVTHALEHVHRNMGDIVQAEKFIHRSFNGEIQRLTERKAFADESLRRCRAMLATDIEDPKMREIISATCSVELRNARRVLIATHKIAESLARVKTLAKEKASATAIESMQEVPEWVDTLKKTADREITRMLAGQRHYMARRQPS
eukprot:939744-Rhodomonas_salina.1